MNIIGGPGKTITLFKTKSVAEAKASELQAQDDSWSYAVCENGGGRFYIEVRDEDGFVLGPI